MHIDRNPKRKKTFDCLPTPLKGDAAEAISVALHDQEEVVMAMLSPVATRSSRTLGMAAAEILAYILADLSDGDEYTFHSAKQMYWDYCETLADSHFQDFRLKRAMSAFRPRNKTIYVKEDP